MTTVARQRSFPSPQNRAQQELSLWQKSPTRAGKGASER
jgi:hypothetical protein